MPKGSRRRVYIGRLDRRTRARDLEDVFNRYGRIRDVELKRDYAFIEFYEPRDAEDAIRDMDGRKLDGSRIIVEWASSSRSDRGSISDDTCFNCGQTGHWANNCKEGDWKDKCYRCGEKGHMKRDCESSRSRSRSKDRNERRRNSSRDRDSNRYRNGTKDKDRKRDRDDSADRSREEARDRSRENSGSVEKNSKTEESPVREEYES
ncbi:unnamed protein product [Blepharisma stoltei]|uniref:Uncharacterized protein n=1 Tax=Blepharisma stoltei TaxID=1481888 RepID=A0AAU9K054_9CILI|nr:unnamed protein product [Blepharisma stoltei]